MTTPAVSVCIPAYRHPSVLVRAVKSAQAQRDCDFEIVVTDDTEDVSVAAALRDLCTDPRLVYHRNPQRLGAVRNWNACIAQARGRAIKILHQDDWFDAPDRLAQFANPVLAGKAQIVFSACTHVDARTGEARVHRASPNQLAQICRQPGVLAYGNVLGAPSVLAFDRNLTSVLFDPAYTWLSDVDFYIRLLRKAGGHFHYIDEPLVRITGNSPDQLSRACERDGAGTAKEYLAMFESLPAAERRVVSMARAFAILGKNTTADGAMRATAEIARSAMMPYALLPSAGYCLGRLGKGIRRLHASTLPSS